mmetsp:Transcript_132154/g.243059  ORF Transcript_132154/g.243059 Transcript_132154/m.243059 type:complete len:397 (+) Transcript_132154:90-1280(+)
MMIMLLCKVCKVCFVALLPSVASASITDTISKYPCIDPLSSKGLSEAVDAALVSLHGQSGWLYNLRQSTGYIHPIEVTACTPKVSMWQWPSADTADGLLANVLQTGKLRVAGVQWKKGGAADYKTNPQAPTGFWPEYMNAIAKAMSSHYGKEITVHRVYYPNSDLVNQAVADGTEADMSEPYYYLGGFHDNKPRIEALDFSCVTVATASAFSSTKASGIKSMDNLYQKIVQGPNRKVGFIGAGNFDAVSHLLPANVEPIFITASNVLQESVDNGTLLASYISEASASETATRFVYETGVISPRVALFRRDSTEQCVRAEALQGVLAPEATAAPCTEKTCDDNTPLMVALIILASVVFLMTSLLTLLICKERGGKPLFMTPLKEQPNGSGQVIGSTL